MLLPDIVLECLIDIYQAGCMMGTGMKAGPA
jgi:hypothetical protein